MAHLVKPVLACVTPCPLLDAVAPCGLHLGTALLLQFALGHQQQHG